jgi:hypothetical protein
MMTMMIPIIVEVQAVGKVEVQVQAVGRVETVSNLCPDRPVFLYNSDLYTIHLHMSDL